MAEYIGKKKVIKEINSWWRTAMMADGKPTLNAYIKALPPADVVERKKIDKAIEDIKNIDLIVHDGINHYYKSGEEVKAEVLVILKRNIEE